MKKLLVTADVAKKNTHPIFKHTVRIRISYI